MMKPKPQPMQRVRHYEDGSYLIDGISYSKNDIVRIVRAHKFKLIDSRLVPSIHPTILKDLREKGGL